MVRALSLRVGMAMPMPMISSIRPLRIFVEAPVRILYHEAQWSVS